MRVNQGQDKLWPATMSAAQATAESMGVGDRAIWVEFGQHSPDDICAILDDQLAESIVIVGDWRGSKFDVYDVVLRFVEERYGRMRHMKFHAGTYVVVVSKKLSMEDEE